MSITTALARLLPRGEERAAIVQPTSDLMDMILGSTRSAAGVQVSPRGSLASTTVMACVMLIARSLASVPLILYRANGDRREKATDHPLYALLHDLANPLQTAMEVRETLYANVLLHGNAYAEIEWGPDGYPIALWPLASDRVGIELFGRDVVYSYLTDSGQLVPIPWYRMHHLRGLATNGLLGISPIREAMNAVGLAIAEETFGARYFDNGARPSLVLSHPGKLTPEAQRNLRASFEAQWAGLGNAHRVAVVGEGVKPEPITIPNNEAQFLEARAFQVEEICRIFNVAPGLVGAAGTQTYASAEQDMIRFRELTLGPWAETHEKAIYRDLLLPEERKTLFAKYRLDKLQATDLSTRYQTYNTAKQAGILTTNEIRSMEDMDPVDGGDILWMPSNMAPADRVASGDTNDANQDNAQPDASRAIQPLLDDARRRIAARIANDVRQQGAKALRSGGRTQLSEWIGHIYVEWKSAAVEVLAPVDAAARGLKIELAAQPNQWIDEAVAAAVGELTNGSANQNI